MNMQRNDPDPQALTIAREMQQQLQPAEVILRGSRAAGDHRPDSDVDLMAVVLDDNGKRQADQILRQLLGGKYEIPVVNVSTITRENFRRTAPMAQSQAGQAARHGVTPEGNSLDYAPSQEPTPRKIRQATIYWLTLAGRHLGSFTTLLEHERFTRFQIPGLEGKTALDRAFKGLLTSTNEPARFRRDAAVMWRHIGNTRPISDRNGASEMEELLRGTTGADGQRCRLTDFSEVFRRGDVMPKITEPEQETVCRHLVPVVNMLIAEALARSGGTREDMEEAKQRPISGAPWWTW